MTTALKIMNSETLDALNDCFVVIDVETTGFSPEKDRIVEFAGIRVEHGIITKELSFLINPKMSIPDRVIAVHGITNEMVKNCDTERAFVPDLLEFFTNIRCVVGHNISFDLKFVCALLQRAGYAFDCASIDTLYYSRQLFKQLPDHKLGTVCKYLRVENKTAHRALSDVMATYGLLQHIAYLAKC